VGWNIYIGSQSSVPLEASLDAASSLLPVAPKSSSEATPQTNPPVVATPPNTSTESASTTDSSTTESTVEKTSATSIAKEALAQPRTDQILDQGTLAIEARNQRFAEEAYILKELADGTFQLVSQGKIKFKIVLIDAEIRYSQAVQWNSDLRPNSFAVESKGPAGFGNRKIQALVKEKIAQITSDGQPSERAVPNEPFFLLSMFSAYAILPQWLAKMPGENLDIPVLTISLRGSESESNKNQNREGPPPATQITIKKLDSAEIQDRKDSSKILSVERYMAISNNISSIVFVAKNQFVGLLSEPAEKSSDRRFFIYRSDLFPNGFSVKVP
jgi:hypothetical protein